MKYLLIFCLLVFSCQKKQENATLKIEVDSKDPNLKNQNGIWMLSNVPFEGYIVEKSNATIISKLPIVKGKENGNAMGWYPDGKKRYQRGFVNGNREGEDKGWYENGRLAFEYFFKNDKYEGPQRTYYESGKKWQILNYKEGYEEGKQKSWSDSAGRVINNFTVKNGKLYGVIGRYDCMSVIKK